MILATSHRKYLLVILVLFLFIISQNDLPAQCAMCKQSAETSLKSNPKSMVRSLNTGILYLMAVPYLAIAFIFRKQLIQLGKKVMKRFSKSPAH